MNKNKLVHPDWLIKNMDHKNFKLIEVDYEPGTAFYIGHIKNAILLDWKKDLNKYPERDIIDKHGFERVLSEKGVSNDDQIILYGDYINWFATFAYRVFKIYGHKKVKVLDCGRNKWIIKNYPMTRKEFNFPKSRYEVKKIDYTLRASFLDVLKNLYREDFTLIDVRSSDEYTGKVTAPPEYENEQAQRGGHIPGAVNIPWSLAVNDDGTIKKVNELEDLYQSYGIKPENDVVVYCRIGERAAFTFFVLKELLKYPKVRVYDGSWSEWGNIVGLPIEGSQ